TPSACARSTTRRTRGRERRRRLLPRPLRRTARAADGRGVRARPPRPRGVARRRPGGRVAGPARRLSRAAARRRARRDDDRAPRRRAPLLLPPPGAARSAARQPGGGARAAAAAAGAAEDALAGRGRAADRRG